MALGATIFKVELTVSDMDRHYYETHKLTVAKHPSETDERLMLRLIAFAMNAHERLELTKGLSTDDEPDLWRKSLSGQLEQWVMLGLPSEKVIRQSCARADHVVICTYGGKADIWWDKIKGGLARFDNLQVLHFAQSDIEDSAAQASRTMKMQVNIQDGELMISLGEEMRYLTPVVWKAGDLALA